VSSIDEPRARSEGFRRTNRSHGETLHKVVVNLWKTRSAPSGLSRSRRS
jgi:hypothetical protein